VAVESGDAAEKSRGLPPWAGPWTSILVLGSFPSVASLEARSYYGHPRNHFWPILEAVYGLSAGTGVRSRRAYLRSLGIGLWDVLGECERRGSLDSRIREAAPNRLLSFLAGLPALERILLNGSYAARTFSRLMGAALPALGESESLKLPGGRAVAVIALPSTSPVPSRAFRRLEDKLPLWRKALL
jgi:double-stranded uracil-DNA glycosylase